MSESIADPKMSIHLYHTNRVNMFAFLNRLPMVVDSLQYPLSSIRLYVKSMTRQCCSDRSRHCRYVSLCVTPDAFIFFDLFLFKAVYSRPAPLYSCFLTKPITECYTAYLISSPSTQRYCNHINAIYVPFGSDFLLPHQNSVLIPKPIFRIEYSLDFDTPT
jgi:hypothetical protein